ncbi:hypothetical protein [Streptomyces sp. NPDC101150]|uniref:hypothetical protein n=1 Tax=Streptomyces sp. NPDC101150 TaxID=3366114 RepID=UPI0037F22B1C
MSYPEHRPQYGARVGGVGQPLDAGAGAPVVLLVQQPQRLDEQPLLAAEGVLDHRSDTPASAATSRMLADSRPRPAAIRQTASAISRRRRSPAVPAPGGGAASAAGAAVAPPARSLCRCRYALAWQLREQ